jgi:hypothetical protein
MSSVAASTASLIADANLISSVELLQNIALGEIDVKTHDKQSVIDMIAALQATISKLSAEAGIELPKPVAAAEPPKPAAAAVVPPPAPRMTTRSADAVVTKDDIAKKDALYAGAAEPVVSSSVNHPDYVGIKVPLDANGKITNDPFLLTSDPDHERVHDPIEGEPAEGKKDCRWALRITKHNLPANHVIILNHIGAGVDRDGKLVAASTQNKKVSDMRFGNKRRETGVFDQNTMRVFVKQIRRLESGTTLVFVKCLKNTKN